VPGLEAVDPHLQGLKVLIEVEHHVTEFRALSGRAGCPHRNLVGDVGREDVEPVVEAQLIQQLRLQQEENL
jgi:hypothetical protein